jgi:hypothetical protein
VVSWKHEALGLLDGFMRRGALWLEPDDIPADVRAGLDALCVEATGRTPSEGELRELLSAST